MSPILKHRCLPCNRNFRSEISLHTHLKRAHNWKIKNVYIRLETLCSATIARHTLPQRASICNASSCNGSGSSDELVISEIPAPAPSMDIARYRIKQPINVSNLIFFDLETGGLARDDDILQISAIFGENLFNAYLLPTKSIAPRASSVNHLTFDGEVLYHRKKPLQALPVFTALEQFIEYLERCSEDPVILAAHNVNFDRRFLMESLLNFNLEERFSRKVAGFLDTVPLFKRCSPNLASYKQERLVERYLPTQTYDSHNALDDVIYLKKLFEHIVHSKIETNNDEIDLSNFSYTTEFAIQKHQQQRAIRKHFSSFENLVKRNVLTKSMAEKISSENLNLQHFQSLYKVKGEQALKEILTQPNSDGKPRITSSETIIQKIFKFFRNS